MIWLVLTSGIVALGALAWWFRKPRRSGTPSYSCERRAAVIERALEQRCDLRITYWSKSHQKFLRRIVTPVALDGHLLRAYDHEKCAPRMYLVTRIRRVSLVSADATTAAVPLYFRTHRGVVWAVALGVPGLLVLMVVLAQQLPKWMPAPKYPIAQPRETLSESNPAASRSGRIAMNEEPIVVTNTARPWDVAAITPGLVPPAGTGQTVSGTVWQVVLNDDDVNTMTHVTDTLARVLRITPAEAYGMALDVNDKGSAIVWRGRWEDAVSIAAQLNRAKLRVRLDTVSNSIPAVVNDTANTQPILDK
jgi:ATP-dependent Clp protease adapter protein ClpS